MSFIIGLTGGIASGKSTVSRMLKDLGAEIIDCDKLAKKVVMPGTEGYKKLRKQFASSFFEQDGSLNRRKLAEYIFENADARKKLEKIIHPHVIDEVNERIIRSESSIIVIDTPLLIEADMLYLIDQLWVVYTKPSLQLKRLMERDNFSEREAKKRIQSQIPLSEKKDLADVVIDNSRSIEYTKKQVLKYWNQIS